MQVLLDRRQRNVTIVASMLKISTLMQQIARIRFGCLMRFAGSMAAGMLAARKARFSAVGMIFSLIMMLGVTRL